MAKLKCPQAMAVIIIAVFIFFSFPVRAENPPEPKPAQSTPTPQTSQSGFKQQNISYTNVDLFADMNSLIDRDLTKKDPMRSYHAYVEVFSEGHTTTGRIPLDE